MFTPARYIVVDDVKAELAPLVEALHSLGTPCIGIHYEPPAPLPEARLFAGVRVLFSDLQLLKGQAADVTHFDTIASLLDHAIPADHGPYVVVLWTSHEAKRAALSDRLMALLAPSKRPLAVLAIDKNLYRTGEAFTQVAELQDAVRASMANTPQLDALLAWERDVLAAANTTLAVLGNLVPDNARTLTAYPGALDGVLSHLAVAAAGARPARANPRAAVNAALAPLLADRILNQTTDAAAGDLWRNAVTFANGPGLTDGQRARMNRLLHLAVPPAETVDRSEWGAVIPFPRRLLTEKSMRKRFGLSAAEIWEQEFRIKAKDHAQLKPVLIRGGAACDQAQSANGPSDYLLGVLRPAGIRTASTPPAACRECGELLQIADAGPPFKLAVHARLKLCLMPDEVAGWPEPLFRLREQLLMTILFHAAAHVMRPGTLRV